MILGWTMCLVAHAQPLTEQEAKYAISGTGIFGGYGLFTLATPDILPKGMFAGGATYESASKERSAALKYSLGLGLASRAEAFVVFSNALGDAKHDLSQVGCKVNIFRGEVREDFLGSVEVGYLQRDRELKGISESSQTLLARLQGGVLFGDIEVTGSLGYAFPLQGTGPVNRFLGGAAAFMPIMRNISIGAEISSDYSASAVDGLGFGAGAKVDLLDHFQITILGRTNVDNSGLAPSLMVGLSFSSAFYHIAPDRKRSFRRVPPLPTLEELEAQDS